MTDQQQLTAAIYDSITEFQRTAHLSSLQHAQMRQYLAEHLAGALTAILPRHGAASDAAQPQPERDAMAAELKEAREELAAAVRVSEVLHRRLSEEQLAGSALYAALTMPTTPEQRQAALDKFTAVAQQVSTPVARPTAVEAHVVADDSDDPEHTDDCPGCTRPCGHDDYHDPHEWADRPGTWCPGISYADDEPARP